VLPVQWDDQHVRLMDPQTKQLMREYRKQERGRYRTPTDYLPKRTPVTTLQLLAMAAHAGKHVGALCSAIHRDKGEWGVKGIFCAATVYRLCERGELPHVRVVNSIRVRRADLEAFVAARAAPPPNAGRSRSPAE
jgi:excisionase family DNA binding protein